MSNNTTNVTTDNKPGIGDVISSIFGVIIRGCKAAEEVAGAAEEAAATTNNIAKAARQKSEQYLQLQTIESEAEFLRRKKRLEALAAAAAE